jgi:hypothetical protein
MEVVLLALLLVMFVGPCVESRARMTGSDDIK